MIPFAVEESRTEPRQRERGHDHDAAGQLDSGPDDHVGPEVSGQPDDARRRGSRRRARSRRRPSDAPAKRESSSVERPTGLHDERLEQPPLGVAGDDAEGQEDGEHDAEEERREHREPEQERPREGAGVDVDVPGRRMFVRSAKT